jgi:twitching motility protein PilT
MDLRAVLETVVELDASDLHLKVGSPPYLRIHGQLVNLDLPPLAAREMEVIADQLLTESQRQEFAATNEIDFAFGIAGLARFRSNFYRQRGTLAMVFRRVSGLQDLSFEKLHLPPVLKDLAERQRGLILVTGTVGSGKSTTLAAMLHWVNSSTSKNIITLEDPIEHLFGDENSYVSQREIGLDTKSFGEGLRHILRQDPDVIMIGEIRDMETMSIALTAADTGHLVLSTLHTMSATETVNRVVSFFPPHQGDSVRYLLASTLEAVVSQRLIPRADNQGRVPAVEVMINTATIADYIIDPDKTTLIEQAMQEGTTTYGMQTFDQSLMHYYTQGIITLEDALANCSNPTEFDLRVKGIHASSDQTWRPFEGAGAEEGQPRPASHR